MKLQFFLPIQACCKLEGNTALFKPVDEDCIYTPSTTNSYMNHVSKMLQFCVRNRSTTSDTTCRKLNNSKT